MKSKLELAEKIADYSVFCISSSLRFMLSAVVALELSPDSEVDGYVTDGKKWLYSPTAIIASYKEQSLIADMLMDIAKESREKELMTVIKEMGETLSSRAAGASDCISNAIKYIEISFSDGMEMEFFVTALNENSSIGSFLRSVSNKDLINHQTDLPEEIDRLINEVI